MLRFITVAITAITLASCQATHQPNTLTPDARATLTPATISNIKKGVSTKNDVITLLGSPNIVTQDSSGQEVWHYSRMQVESFNESSGTGTALLPGILVQSKQSQAFATTSSKSFDLAVTFNAAGTVELFKSVTSQF